MKINIVIIISILLFISCADRKPKNKVDEEINNVERASNNLISLPDTVIVNKVYKKELKYSSDLDTINLSEKDERFIILYLTTQDGEYNEVESIEKVDHKAFTTNKDSDSLIPFEFSFKYLGEHQLKGIIEDMVVLDNYYDDGKSRIITYLTTIEKQVFVKEQKVDESFAQNGLN